MPVLRKAELEEEARSSNSSSSARAQGLEQAGLTGYVMQ
jgi:hypothetical protein